MRRAGQQRAVMNINRCLIRVQQGERELTLRNAFTLSSSLWEYSREIEFCTCNYFLPRYGRFCNSLYASQLSRHGLLDFYLRSVIVANTRFFDRD